jgi:hypothetical protein
MRGRQNVGTYYGTSLDGGLNRRVAFPPRTLVRGYHAPAQPCV